MTATKRVLVILHQEHSTAGRVGRLLEELGCQLDVRRPRFGDVLPENMVEHAGAIVFGGPMSANDSEKYIREEIAWLSKPLGENKPYLGICLGAQLLTRHLGSKVYKLENGAIEAGYYPIIPLPQAQELTSEENILFPEMVYQWHSEGCDLPYGATLLAEGLTFPVQAYQYGSHAFAIQFHPEVTYMTIDRWTRLGGERLRMPGAKPSSEHLSDWHLYDQNVAQWIKAFLPRWLNNEDSS